MMDRNLRETEDINIKPQIHNTLDKSMFQPNKYLNSRKEHLNMKDTESVAPNTTMNRLLNMRKSNAEQLNTMPLAGGLESFKATNYLDKHNGKPTKKDVDRQFKMNVSQRRQIHHGRSVSEKGDFEKRREFNKTLDVTSHKSSLATQGEIILEKKFQISKDEHSYYKNNRVYSNINKHIGGGKSPIEKQEDSGAEHNRYAYNMPSYFRMMDNPNYRNIQHKNVDGKPLNMMQIVSKNQGWITVESEKMDRQHPMEKMRLGDVSKVNVLSPQWMQVTHKKPGPDPLMPVVPHIAVREEAKRSIFVEKNQPQRSIFNTGSIRHNVHSTELTKKYMDEALRSGKVSAEPQRLLQWNENSTQQNYDKHVSPKIGSNHFV